MTGAFSTVSLGVEIRCARRFRSTTDCPKLAKRGGTAFRAITWRWRNAGSRHGSGGAHLGGLGARLRRHKAGARQLLGRAAHGAALPHRLPAGPLCEAAADRISIARPDRANPLHRAVPAAVLRL